MEGLPRGVPLQKNRGREKVQVVYEKPNYQLTGATPDDLVGLILAALAAAQKAAREAKP
jgi:hypothetical protein